MNVFFHHNCISIGLAAATTLATAWVHADSIFYSDNPTNPSYSNVTHTLRDVYGTSDPTTRAQGWIGLYRLANQTEDATLRSEALAGMESIGLAEP